MVTIPVGTSRRSALLKLHREHAMFVRSTDVEALEEEQSTLRGLALACAFQGEMHHSLARGEGVNATATRLDWIFLCVLKQPIAL